MGSKFKLLENLIPLFPTNISTFVDLFTGSGTVYMNVAHFYDVVIANDNLPDLITIHENLKNSEFINSAINSSQLTKNNSDCYASLRTRYNEHKRPEDLLALIWSCNSNIMRFNKSLKFNQTWGKRCCSKNNKSQLKALYHVDLSNVEFQSKSFENVEIPENSFVYLDPPYSNTSAGYNIIWDKSCDIKLLALVKKFIHQDTLFGISGVINEKPNKLFDFLKTTDLTSHFFGDMYKKISKNSSRENTEFYFTNVNS